MEQGIRAAGVMLLLALHCARVCKLRHNVAEVLCSSQQCGTCTVGGGSFALQRQCVAPVAVCF
jgi:hypothetical protein